LKRLHQVKIHLAIFAGLVVTSVPQTTFSQMLSYTVKGQLNARSERGKVYLVFAAGQGYTVDSATITGGVFRFNGKSPGEVHASLLYDHIGTGLAGFQANSSPDVCDLYLENRPLTVSGKDSIKTAVISGGVLNKDNNELKIVLKPVNQQLRTLVNTERLAPPEKKQDVTFQKTMQDSYLNILSKRKTLIEGFIRSHPASKVAFDSFLQTFNANEDPVAAEKVFHLFRSSIRNAPEGCVWQAKLESFKHTALGVIAPDFTLPDTSGKRVALKSFRGKYLLIDFWASWCKPCRMENPNVVEAYKKYHLKNFTILGVSLDQPNGKESWLNAIHKDKLIWTQLSDLQYWNNAAAVLYGIRSIPANILLDPGGKIIGRDLRGAELDDTLNSVLK